MLRRSDPNPRANRASRVCAAVVGGLIAVALVSCAPEPGDTSSTSGTAGAPSKEDLADGKGGSGGSWSEENPEGVGEKSAVLPDSFPSDTFVIPEGTAIDDAGERSGAGWFVVLRAEDINSGAELWTQVINGSGFEATDVSVGVDNETFATLTNASLTVDALMIPQEDDTALLSYEVSSTS